jgi:hypothetical protein
MANLSALAAPSAAPLPTPGAAGAPPLRQAALDLARALRTGDLKAARAAGQQIARDLRAALTPAIPGDPTVVPAAPPAPSTTGGTAGTLLNVVA